jgi:DNA-binding NarL/FixJ family response regulator
MFDMSRGRVRIILADDHTLLRAGLSILLEQVEGVEIVGEAEDGDALIRLAEALEPDLVFTDLAMPRTDGVEAIRHLARTRPRVRCVVLSMHDSPELVRRAAKAGAAGYVLKNASIEELQRAIDEVLSRGAYFSPALALLLLAPTAPAAADLLTERQMEILQLVASGLSSKDIAVALDLSPRTVDVHRSRIMERLALHDVASLTRYAITHGLVAN